jgi:hypothetical protein
MEIIRQCGGQVYYTVLAGGLTAQQSKAGEQAIFRELGIRRDGGWLMNHRQS